MIHELKTWPEYFHEIFMGHKTFEIRENDRNFNVGDTLILKEYNPVKKSYTGREMARKVTYLMKGGKFGLQEGFVIMAIQ